MIIRSIIRVAITLVTIVAAKPVHAVVLLPGVTAPLPGTTAAAEPQLAGVVLEDVIQPFVFSDGGGGTITGTVQNRVTRSSVDGTMDFYWRVINDPTSTAAIGDFRLGDFVAPEYNANFRIDGVGNKAPDSATRFSGASDSFVNFNFDVFSTDPAAGLRPGQSSNFLLLDTTATGYAKNATYDLTNMVQNPISIQYPTFGPAPNPTKHLPIAITARVSVVDDRGGFLGGAINVGDLIHGIYIYDPNTADSNPLGTVGDYHHVTSPYGITLHVNGLEFRTDPANVDFLVEIVNDHNSPPTDNYLLRSYNNIFAKKVSPDPNGFPVDNHISWQLDDPTAAAISGESLPVVPPVLANWQSIFGLSISSDNSAGDSFLVRANGFSAVIAGDFDSDGDLDVNDVNALCDAVQTGTNPSQFDVTWDGFVNSADLATWVNDLKLTYSGDANLDGEFSTTDFVVVFQAGKFETGQPANWSEGDWNCDGVFNSSDLVMVFQEGRFETGPRHAVGSVPEPSALALVTFGICLLCATRAIRRGRSPFGRSFGEGLTSWSDKLPSQPHLFSATHCRCS